MKRILLLWILALSINSYGQTIDVPDPFFEQALIDFGHDEGSFRLRDTIYREGDLYTLFKNIENDTLLMFERMASFHFHQLLNQYRTSKRKKTVYWDDKLWLAARNHNVYLLQNNKHLSHTESSSKPYFTGKQPEDRMEYVTYGSKEYKFGGFENCAVSGEMEKGSMDLNYYDGMSWDDMIETAKNAAEEMFEMWKSSLGHNQNMLDADHLTHGTSIIFAHSANYATSVFTQKQTYFAPDSLSVSFHEGLSDKFEVLFEENGQAYKVYPHGMSRVEFKLFVSLTQNMNRGGILPNKKLYKLLKYEKEHPEDSRSLKKKYLKVTNYLGLFKLLKYELTSVKETYILDFDQFYSFEGIRKIDDVLFNNDIMTADQWSGVVSVTEKNNRFQLEIIIYLLGKPLQP